MTILDHTPASVDEVAVRDLDTAAQRAGLDGPTITRDGGPTAIRFDSLARFAEWCDYGLIRIRNAYEIVVEGAETHVPVLFGHPSAWNAVAIYPAAPLACTCDAELVHQVGCAADVAGPVVVLDVPPTEGCSYCGGTTTDHFAGCTFYLPRRTPGATLDGNPPTVTEAHYTTADLRGTPACRAVQPYATFATVDRDAVTCPDCRRAMTADVLLAESAGTDVAGAL